MTLCELIKIADDAYPDGLVMTYHKHPKGNGHGDGLAKFIAVELKETFDPEEETLEQIINAAGKIRTAIDELIEVVEAFNVAANKIVDEAARKAHPEEFHKV